MLLIKNIGWLIGILSENVRYLRGSEMSRLNSIQNAWLLIDGEKIKDFGAMASCPNVDADVIDADGGIVSPTFCDSHTHMVYAGSREQEFIDKINGLSYEEIARNGGGILNSADLLHCTSENVLFEAALRRLRQIVAMGTGAVEIKSGYGLTLQDELKMLRVIRRLSQAMPKVGIKATFLGAHAVGRAFSGRQSEYVNHVVNDMIPAVAADNLADFVDVFCDEGFFTPVETDRIIKAAKAYGMPAKIHANELACSGGVQIGVGNHAISVDHLERIGQDEITLLSQCDTVATMLPGASFFLKMPFAPAKEAISNGCIVALASDWNPGSSPSGSMPFVISLGCIRMGLTPEEAFNAVTINGAAAMKISADYGSITRGKYASLIIYNNWAKTVAYIPYAYTEPTIKHVILKGSLYE